MSIVLRVRLRWAYYVARMEDMRMPNAVFSDELKKKGSAIVVP